MAEKQETRSPGSRLGLLAVCFLLMAGAIGWRLYQLQVAHRDVLRARADSQQIKEVVVPATRGAILDRNGEELAVSLETFSLYAHPRRVSDPQRAARLLAPVLGQNEGKLLSRLRADRSFVWLARFLEPKVADAVRALELELDDARIFGLLPEPRRHYPKGDLAAHVVGYATIDGDGVAGIESRFDDELSGAPVRYLVQQDGRNGRIRLPAPETVKQARDVVLTLDAVLQHIAERELEQAMNDTGARAASAVLLDPATGQVLALANRPTADPNHWGDSEPADQVNRAVVHAYEPGSTFKMIPLSPALELGRVRPEQRFDCEDGLYVVRRRRIKDVAPHGLLTVPEILAESSNIGMVKATASLEPAELRAYIQRFGFGERTGIELPGETTGIFRHESRWSDFTQASLSFGQEIGVSALQMTAALAAIANDGEWIAPRVVLGTRDADGTLRRAPEAPRRRVIEVQTARTLQDMMEGVIEEGTGKRAVVAGYRVAGKSGTAQKATGGAYSPTDYMASFGGFGPVGRPRLVALVVLDSPRGAWVHGGQVAAPVFGRIMTDGLRYLRTAYDRPAGPPAPERPTQDMAAAAALRSDTLARPVQPGIVPELLGLGAREAVARLAAHGYRPVVTGSGRVLAQSPAAGTVLAVGEICNVALGDPPPTDDAVKDAPGDVMEAAVPAVARRTVGGTP